VRENFILEGVEVWRPSILSILDTRRFVSNPTQEQFIYYDPWLDESPVACVKRGEVEKVDIVIPSHGHNDHVRDASKFVIKLKSVLLVTM